MDLCRRELSACQFLPSKKHTLQRLPDPFLPEPQLLRAEAHGVPRPVAAGSLKRKISEQTPHIVRPIPQEEPARV
jgi:hypothetical protein